MDALHSQLTHQDAQPDPQTVKGQAFDPMRTAPDHTAQGDEKPAVFDDPGRAGRPYTREASGATGARSGSVSRERSQSQTRGRDAGIDNGSGARRVLSPSRAMGAVRPHSVDGADRTALGQHHPRRQQRRLDQPDARPTRRLGRLGDGLPLDERRAAGGLTVLNDLQ